MSLFIKSVEVSFPKKIGNYTFIKSLAKIGVRKSYQLALYRNSKGQKAIAKMRGTKIKGYHYFSLLNEIQVYTILNKALERSASKRPAKFKSIVVPRLIGGYEDKKRLIALIEFAEGAFTEKLSVKKRLSVYILMQDFIQYIGEQMTGDERSFISQRGPFHFIMLYPFLFIKAVMTYPPKAKELIKGTPLFISAAPDLIASVEKKLTHRDLHFMNILYKGNKLVLLDLQQCVFTDPLHDYITTLRYFWKEDDFYKLLMQHIIKQYGKRERFVKVFKALAVNSVTHGLSGAGFNEHIINGWIEFLKFSVKGDFSKI
jgi:hypothetical protein